MKRLSMILSWQKVIIIGLAVLAGGTVTAFEMNAASQAVDGKASNNSTEDRNADPDTGSKSESADSTFEQRQDSRDSQASRTGRFSECYAALQKAQKKLSQISDYSATFTLRERVAGELTEKQQIDLRVRHKPFSVHMKWVDEGREAIFVEGQNNNKLVVKPGGLAALVGTLELDPKGETAMEEARYPITEAGMLMLIEKVMAHQKPLLKNQNGVTCRQSTKRCEGEDCDCFVLTYDAPSICDGYATTTLHISRESGLLVSIENHRFDKSSKSGTSLAEHYVFTDVKPDIGFSDGDFKLARSGITGRVRTAMARRASSR